MKMDELLESVAWGQKNFGSLCSGGPVRLRDLRRAIKAGLVQSQGQVALCSPDGGTLDPERFREGFVLTESGAQELARIEEAKETAWANTPWHQI